MLGTPGVNLAGGYYADGTPFSVIFLGEAWSEAKLLALACDYEQATSLRREPSLTRRRPPLPPYRNVAGKADRLPKIAG